MNNRSVLISLCLQKSPATQTKTLNLSLHCTQNQNRKSACRNNMFSWNWTIDQDGAGKQSRYFSKRAPTSKVRLEVRYLYLFTALVNNFCLERFARLGNCYGTDSRRDKYSSMDDQRGMGPTVARKAWPRLRRRFRQSQSLMSHNKRPWDVTAVVLLLLRCTLQLVIKLIFP